MAPVSGSIIARLRCSTREEAKAETKAAMTSNTPSRVAAFHTALTARPPSARAWAPRPSAAARPEIRKPWRRVPSQVTPMTATAYSSDTETSGPVTQSSAAIALTKRVPMMIGAPCGNRRMSRNRTRVPSTFRVLFSCMVTSHSALVTSPLSRTW